MSSRSETKQLVVACVILLIGLGSLFMATTVAQPGTTRLAMEIEVVPGADSVQPEAPALLPHTVVSDPVYVAGNPVYAQFTTAAMAQGPARPMVTLVARDTGHTHLVAVDPDAASQLLTAALSDWLPVGMSQNTASAAPPAGWYTVRLDVLLPRVQQPRQAMLTLQEREGHGALVGVAAAAILFPVMGTILFGARRRRTRGHTIAMAGASCTVAAKEPT